MSMSNTFDITIDFDNICRTCLAREDLKPLYEKCISEKLMFCAFVKFSEDDGLPGKICTNCIDEINQAFSFAKRCETTDSILRKCVTIRTKLANDSFQSQEIEKEIKMEVILPNMHRTGQEVLGDFKCIGDAKQEEDAKIEIKTEIFLPNLYQTVEEDLNIYEEVKQDEEVKIEYQEVKQEEDVNIEFEFVDPADESYEKNDDEIQDEMYSEKSDNSSSRRKRKVILDSHLKNVCSFCSKDFICPSKLKVHMRIHTGERPFSCKFCSKTFTHSNTLKNHIRIHTGEKPYTCEVCHKAFVKFDILKNHRRIHTGEKPYSCEICSKTFSQIQYLKQHVRTHTGEKPYTCEVCSKAFVQFNNLKTHMRIHTGEKPYSCEVCSKVFTYSSNLKNHMSGHHVLAHQKTTLR